MPVKIPELKSIRIFLSYSNHDKEIVGALKDLLEKIGFEVFLAHEDIEPSLEWQDEILKNLERCDVFIPFLTERFRDSKWTDQETGIAIAMDKFIIPLQAGIQPYGFIGKTQSLKLFESPDGAVDLDKTVKEIARILFNNRRLRRTLKEFVIRRLIESKDYSEAKLRAPLLNYFKKFTDKEVNRICEGAIKNNQVHEAFAAKPILRRLLHKYRRVIKPKTYKILDEALSKGLTVDRLIEIYGKDVFKKPS